MCSRGTVGWWLGLRCLERSDAALRFSHLGSMFLSRLVLKVPDMRQCSVFACQSVSLIGLDGDDAFQTRLLYGSIGNVNDCHKLLEERPLEDAIVADVEACDFEC
jgi:hypothetical protein